MTVGPVGLLEACDDPRLLGFPLWSVQRDLLADVERERLHVWALGRRSGKTTLGAVVGLHSCLFRPDLDAMVRQGERRYVVAVATRLDQSRLFVQAALSIVERSPLLAGMVERATEDEIYFSTGAVLAAFPATSRGARGWPVSTLLFDEAAHMLDTEGNQAAEPLFRSLSPATLQFGQAARILVVSTPYGESGFFADLFHRARDGQLDGAVARRFSSPEVNPTLDPGLLEQEHARDPDGYRGEILAEFIGSGGAFIDATRLAESVEDRGELGRDDARDWILGVDLGFASDPTGVVAVGRDKTDSGRLRLGLARSWAPQRSATFAERREVEDRVLSDVAEIALHFRARVVCDQHLAPQVRDFLRGVGVHVETLALTAETKTLSFTELRSRLYTGTLELFPHEDLLRELRGLRTRFSAGKSGVVTPRTSRGHSDMAVALALATWRHDMSGISVRPARSYVARGRIPLGAPLRPPSYHRPPEPAPPPNHSLKGAIR